MADKAKVARQNRRRGRANENNLADYLVQKGIPARALGVLGKEDIMSGPYSIEAKSFQKFAGEKILSQSESHKLAGQIAIGVVHLNGARRDKDIVLLRLEDFIKLHHFASGQPY